MMGNIVLNNEVKLGEIGYGTYPHKDKLVESIPVAARIGYRLFDTSDNYGNESYVGKAFEKLDDDIKASCMVITKFSKPEKTGAMNAYFEDARKKLALNHIIYLMHWPYPFIWKRIWRNMERLYLDGKADAIGVCNFDEKKLNKLLRICEVKPSINQIECHPMFQQRDIVEFCRKNGICIMSYSPLARNDARLMDNKTLVNIAKNHNRTVSEIIIKWNICHNFIPIPSSVSREHMESNFQVYDIELSEEEISQIDELDCNLRVRFDPRKRFTFKNKLKYMLLNIRLALNL